MVCVTILLLMRMMERVVAMIAGAAFGVEGLFPSQGFGLTIAVSGCLKSDRNGPLEACYYGARSSYR